MNPPSRLRTVARRCLEAYEGGSDSKNKAVSLQRAFKRLKEALERDSNKQVTITGSAILMQGVMWCLPAPARHCHVMWVYHRATCWNHEKQDYDPIPIDIEERMIQGFVTSEGEFVNRLDGAEIALLSGQITALQWPPDLYSEDLW